MHGAGPLQLIVLLLILLCSTTTRADQPPPESRLTVEITGVEGELLENVRASLGLVRIAREPDLGKARVQSFFKRARPEIQKALQPFGYYKPEIRDSLQDPGKGGGPWLARFEIDAGPALTVNELDLNYGEAADILSGDFPLAVGDTLDHRLYKQGKQDLLRRARAAGYLKARLLLSRIEVDLKAYRATVRIHLDPGPLHRFCGLTFDQEGFEEDYLREFVPMRVGDPYTQDNEAELRRALVSSGNFRHVEIERLELDPDSPEVYLLVHLEPHKPNRYRARFGYGTDTGFGLHFDWTRRNLWQEGHLLDVGTVLVQERAKLVGEVNYSIPSDPLFNQRIELFARHQGKDLSAADAGLDDGDKTRILNNTLGIDLPRKRRFWNGLELRESLSVTYLTESYDLFEMLFGNQTEFVQTSISNFLGDQVDIMQANYRGLVLGADWTYRTMDDPLFTQRGDYLSLSLKGAYKGLASNFTFAQAHVKGAVIRPMGAGRLILRGEVAYTQVETKKLTRLGNIVANQLPELYEFRAGGDRSVRGFRYDELLPDDSFTGGKHLLVGSVEYEHEIIPNWSAAVFLDTGTAFNTFNELKPGIGIGAGARWRSPVGPVRLDLAVPLTDADAPFRIHITIGPEI